MVDRSTFVQKRIKITIISHDFFRNMMGRFSSIILQHEKSAAPVKIGAKGFSTIMLMFFMFAGIMLPAMT